MVGWITALDLRKNKKPPRREARRLFVKCRMLFFGLGSLLFVNDHLRCGLFKLPPPFWSPAARTSICLSFGQLLLEQLRSCPAASFCLTRKIKIIESRGTHK